MIQHRDISRRYLMSFYGLVGWRDLNLAFTVSYCGSGLVVRVSGYRYRGPGFDPRRYQIF